MSVTANNLATRFQEALALHRQGQVARAEALYRDILAAEPRHFDALHMLGIAAGQTGQAETAVELLTRATALKPDHAAAFANLGKALNAVGRVAEALNCLDRALAIEPGLVDALSNRGVILQNLGRSAEALTAFDRLLSIRPDQAQAHASRGVALQSLSRFEEALASYDRALALRPEDPSALNNRGVVLQNLGRYAEALASIDRSGQLQPGDALTLCNRASVLHNLQRFAEALASAEEALATDPRYAEAHQRRGLALQALGRPTEALASFDRVLSLRPEDVETAYNRGVVLHDLRRYEDALASYEQALAIRPDLPDLQGAALNARLMLCDWTGLDAAISRLAAAIEAGKPVAPPLALMPTSLPLRLQRRCAEIYVQHRFPAQAAGPGSPLPPRHDRIRLGYFSADFREHPVAQLTAGLFEHHDRDRFELIAFAMGPPAMDALRGRIEAAFDTFVSVRAESDDDIAKLARRLGIDIAVDLMGFTLHSRTGIFARRAAPLQISYLGYPGTLGADYIDYIIADETVLPREHFPHYAESVVHLPYSYQANDSSRPISERHFTRAEMGLPEAGFVFCNLNHCYKIMPTDFDGWMRLLARLPGSVLWLAGTNPVAERNLRREAAARDVAPDRLVFKRRTERLADHLAQLRLADLFVDTASFGAHSTASDALWAGLPVLTRLGETFAGRVAASLLRAVGLPELVTGSAEAYAELALALASDAPRLAALRGRLAANRLSSPLFDTARFARHLEAAYTAMWQRHQAGLPPEHIAVDP